MPIKSYLFKSTMEGVENLSGIRTINKTFGGIESTGIDPTTLTVLESILTGEDFYNIYEKGEYKIIKKVDEEDENSALFVSSSATLIECLKTLEKKNKKSVLEQWCATQEMQLYGWTPEKAEHIIDWLIETSQENTPDEHIILFIDFNWQVEVVAT
jgi:hypothetical protein